MEGGDQGSRIEQDRSVGHAEIALFDGPQVFTRYASLADSPGTEIQQFVSVIFDFVE